jgi:hypothetical protein
MTPVASLPPRERWGIERKFPLGVHVRPNEYQKSFTSLSKLLLVMHKLLSMGCVLGSGDLPLTDRYWVRPATRKGHD